MPAEKSYLEYPFFKGLQKPLEFMGLRGRYIYWAAGADGGALLSFLALYVIIGFLVALIVATVILCFGASFIFIKQSRGLHSKKEPKGIFITAHTFEFR